MYFRKKIYLIEIKKISGTKLKIKAKLESSIEKKNNAKYVALQMLICPKKLFFSHLTKVVHSISTLQVLVDVSHKCRLL